MYEIIILKYFQIYMWLNCEKYHIQIWSIVWEQIPVMLRQWQSESTRVYLVYYVTILKQNWRPAVVLMSMQAPFIGFVVNNFWLGWPYFVPWSENNERTVDIQLSASQ